MSSFAFRCPKTGLVEFAPCAGKHPCPFCGKKHLAYETGVQKKPEGLGFRTRPPFKPIYSVQHGRRLESWTDYHNANRELDLVDSGEKPDSAPIPATKGKHFFLGRFRK